MVYVVGMVVFRLVIARSSTSTLSPITNKLSMFYLFVLYNEVVSCIMMNINLKMSLMALSPDALKQDSEKDGKFPLEGLIVHHT
ncbi:hypothetical protein N5V81_27600, partial [Escherichia coli]|nr:hypothetical protein [Escherichia coli]